MSQILSAGSGPRKRTRMQIWTEMIWNSDVLGISQKAYSMSLHWGCHKGCQPIFHLPYHGYMVHSVWSKGQGQMLPLNSPLNKKVLGQNVSGQNVTDKISRTKCYVDKMSLDKMSRTKCRGQNVADNMSWLKCRGQNVVVKMSGTKCRGQNVVVNVFWSKCSGQVPLGIFVQNISWFVQQLFVQKQVSQSLSYVSRLPTIYTIYKTMLNWTVI